MKVAFVGAGRLATNLAPALQRANIDVVEVWSRTRGAAELLARQVNKAQSSEHQVLCHAVWGTLEQLTRDADIYIISVTDAALPQVICQLHAGREGALFAHTAGSLPLALFGEAGHQRGAVFYPMQTFSKERAVDFSQAHFFIEASEHNDFELLKQMAVALTPPENIHACTSAMRRQLHLAAVFACNFVNHCCTLADEVLAEAGLDFDVMLPLLDETVAKLHQLPPRSAQTGPAARKDQNVMGMQRAMLADRPHLQRIYTLLSESIMET